MTGRFSPGDAVRVRAVYPPGHCRTPGYCRGRAGQVVRVCGAFRNPEQLAYGAEDPQAVTLYRVRFASSELWPDDVAEGGHSVEIELYEGWLEPVGPARLASNDSNQERNDAR